MKFASNTSRKATSIVMNYASPSLYSAIHSGVKTWPAGLSIIKTPPNIDRSCLVRGFNMLGPHPWVIKSRIGVKTQPGSLCTLPYLVRGVGISWYWHGYHKIPCGELIIGQSNVTVETYPASCRVYIQ